MATGWSNEETFKFIELYQACPEIWNPKHKYHKDKNKVNDAWGRIADEMLVPVGELKKKKDTLLAAFRLNHKKVVASRKSGVGENDVHKPIWIFYDALAAFMSDVYGCKSILATEDSADASISSQDEDSMTQRENVENQDPNIVTENSNIQIPVQRRRSRNPPELQETNKEMKKAFSTLNSVLSKQPTKDSEDDCDLYGKLLAKRLRQFTEIEKQELMYEIDGLLLKKRQTSLSRQRTGRYVVQSPSQIILQTRRPSSCYTRTSTPLASRTYVPRPTSSLSTYSTSTTSNDTDRPPSNFTAYSPPNFSHNANATPEQVPVQISIPEQSFYTNLESESQSILHQAFVQANIDDLQETYQ